MHSSHIASYKKVPLPRPKTLALKYIVFWGSLQKIFCVGYLQFSGFFSVVQVHLQQLYCHLWQNARAQFEFLQYLWFFSVQRFSFKITQQFSSSAFWYVDAQHMPCTYSYLWVCAFVLTRRNLKMCLLIADIWHIFCLTGPVCIFDACKIKHNWRESVVKGNKWKEQKCSEAY